MATQYQRARTFEYAVRDDMARHGFVTVRSPASKTPVDVYCIGWDTKVFIQCKTNMRVGPEEWNKFLAFCRSVDAVPVIAGRNPNGRGIRYALVTDWKVPHRRQPMVDWVPYEGGRVEVSGAEGGRD